MWTTTMLIQRMAPSPVWPGHLLMGTEGCDHRRYPLQRGQPWLPTCLCGCGRFPRYPDILILEETSGRAAGCETTLAVMGPMSGLIGEGGQHRNVLSPEHGCDSEGRWLQPKSRLAQWTCSVQCHLPQHSPGHLLQLEQGLAR